MPTVVDRLMSKTGKDRAELAKSRRAGIGSVFRRAGVSDSSELKRILDLPRRDWEVGMGGRFGTTAELQELLSLMWRRPGSSAYLWPVQAVALAELHDFGGLVGPIRTSGGKTLISFLAARAAGVEVVVLIVPSLMKDITIRKWKILSQDWDLPEIIIVDYNHLSREANKRWLWDIQPGMIVADEAHKLKNLKAACTKHVHWYLTDFPDTIFVPLSGTPFNRSLSEVGHLVQWALPKFCPIPRDYGTLLEWCLCLDEEKTGTNALGPGKLIRLCNSEELELLKTEPLKAVRQAFQRRFTETPGVVSVSDPGVTIPLVIRGFDLDIDSAEVDRAFTVVRRHWQRPDGFPFAEAVKVWAFCRQLACGFYYRWRPDPPKAWLRARTSWCRDLRHILSHNNRRLASELQVANAIRSGLYEVPSYWDWVQVRDTYDYIQEPVWVHDRTIEYAADWLSKNPQGICWTEHNAFAHRLAEVTGLPFFWKKGRDSVGNFIEDASGPIIASYLTNGTGRDLQHSWSKNLIVSCAPNGEVWEQLLARTHRFGQKAKQVEVDVFLGCSEQYFGLQQAIRDCEFSSSMLKQSRKLLVADIQVAAIEDVVANKATRWNKMVRK